MIEQILETLKFLVANPAIAAFFVVIVLIVYLLRKRSFQSVLTRQSELYRSGWVTPAGKVTRVHETGGGEDTILVMRPPRRQSMAAVWSLLFFGACAAFMWFVQLSNQSEQTAKNWFGFAIASAFSVMAIFLFATSFSRIHVSAVDIVQYRLLRRSRKFLLKEISAVELAGKSPSSGVKLVFFDGRHVRLPANYEGYAEVLDNIQRAHPSLPKLLAMGRIRDMAIEKRKKHRNTR
ncbi:hypothetical protein [Roseibium aggregatum]|uniref:Uncharacterized protein n=1 Tax=Roseibium aggregatum TaxID=187304 RepID=A0A939J6X2_9HYPH|nr:hypothetical protein [Roseibium aggregatum]MBN9673740.1 hypothetical protein [Roseibium aggregatum]